MDLSEVSFLASIGMRTLLSNAKALGLKGGRMVLLNPQPMVATALSTAGIDTLIPMHQDLEPPGRRSPVSSPVIAPSGVTTPAHCEALPMVGDAIERGAELAIRNRLEELGPASSGCRASQTAWASRTRCVIDWTRASTRP